MQLKIEVKSIWLADRPVDFRKAVIGLSAVIVDQMKKEPRSGLFVFYNKARNRLKLLSWHGNGFVMIYKRLEKGCFSVGREEKRTISGLELDWLLAGLDWQLLRNWDEAKALKCF